MKTIKFTKLKGIVAMFSMSIVLFGCDLELNTGYDFDPQLDLVEPYGDGTAWDFIQSPEANQLTEAGGFDGDRFNYFVEAIKAADMIDEYNQSVTTDRTYLLLNNNAFLGGGDVIQIVTGSSAIPDGETPAETMARADVDKLKTVLSYHIVTTYINQVPVLFNYDVDYIFQTLIPGDDGLIAFRRTNRYAININNSNAPLPSSATSQSENVRNHNYVFNNGIGHMIADPVRNQPY